MITRWAEGEDEPKGPMATVTKIFENVGTAKVATSAQDAISLKFLRNNDRITMNRSRLLSDAKRFCLELVNDYEAPEQKSHYLAGESGKVTLDLAVSDLVKAGHATPHDVTVTSHLSYILTGGDTDPTQSVSDEDILRMEKEGIMSLMKTEETMERIEHMLSTGKPLRN